jgi:hypothetical protein
MIARPDFDIVSEADIEELIIHRKYNGEYKYEFPNMKEEVEKQLNINTQIGSKIVTLLPKFVY